MLFRSQMILLDQTAQGYEAAKVIGQLRESIKNEMLILLLCDSGEEEMVKDGNCENIDGILTKPFFVSALKERIAEIRTVQEDEKAQESSNEAEESVLDGCHFLVAEDNEINSEILQEILGLVGVDCEIVENGEQAVACFDDAPPGQFDAILMDVQMPVMNGYEATKRIRALARDDAKTIPIIAMTANAFTEDVREALNAGMDAHLAKPIDLELLKNTLVQYIGKNIGKKG